jgi:hypothetical protein
MDYHYSTSKVVKNQTIANQPAVVPLETEVKVGFNGSAKGVFGFSFGSFLLHRNIEREKNTSARAVQ